MPSYFSGPSGTLQKKVGATGFPAPICKNWSSEIDEFYVSLRRSVMAHLHCQRRTRIHTRIRTPKPNGYIALFRSFHAAKSDSDSKPNCKLQEWDQNPSPYPSLSPAM